MDYRLRLITVEPSLRWYMRLYGVIPYLSIRAQWEWPERYAS